MLKRLLLVVLCLCFVMPQTFAANLDSLVPANADLVIRANVQQVLNIPELKAKLDEALKSEEAKKYETIFNVKQDINSVVVFVPFEAVEKGSPSNSAVGMIADGNFDADKIIEEIKKAEREEGETITVTEEDGLKTVNYNDGKGNESKVVFLDKNTIIMGTVTGVETVKSVKAGKTPAVASKADFAASLAKLSQTAQVSGVFALPESAKQSAAANEQLADLGKVNFVRFGLTKMEDLDLEIIGDFAEAANVENVKTAIDGLIKMLASNPAPYSALEDLVKNFASKVDGKSLAITSKITKASLEKLAASNGAPEASKVAPQQTPAEAK